MNFIAALGFWFDMFLKVAAVVLVAALIFMLGIEYGVEFLDVHAGERCVTAWDSLGVAHTWYYEKED